MTLPDCLPGDHDETGVRTDQHEMDLIPVRWILDRAQREGWPSSSIDAMANHHLCGNPSRGYATSCLVQSKEGTPEMSACPKCGGDHGDGMICTPWPKGDSKD